MNAMNIDKPTKFLKDVSVIVGIVIGGWFALEAIFATKQQMARHEVQEIEREIDTLEKRRNYYENKVDHGEDLDVFETRRLKTNNQKLDRLYDELDSQQALLEELE
jgi:hypothetical protein